jgi:hypothetical protein
MQDADLFMELAAIAGVFVGFGALIAVRSGGPSEALEVSGMRMMVSMAMLTIAAALAPVALGRYDLTDHQVWALGSALILIGWLFITVVSAGTPEYRASWAMGIAAIRLTLSDIVGWGPYVLLLLAWVVIPIIVLLGVAPELEAALYLTYLVLLLLGTGSILLMLVFAQRRPASAGGDPATPG